MKKFLAILLTIALTASFAVAGTLAYLTVDAGNEINVFTVGNIDVSLDEDVGIYGEGGEAKKTDDGAEYIEVMPGDYLKKEVTVSNDGKTPAYVAVTVKLNNADKINAAIDEVYENDPYKYEKAKIQSIYDNIFDGWGINYNPRPGAAGVNDARGVIDGTYGLPEHTLKVDFAKTTKGSTVIGATNWFVAGKEKAGQYWVDGPATYDGYYTKDMNDYEICYTYYLYLEGGESSTLFNGLNVPAAFNADQLKMFDGLKIDIEAKAIQADNMFVDDKYAADTVNGKAKTAFAILAGDITVEEDLSNKPSGNMNNVYTRANGFWGENGSNAKESHVIKLYSGNTYMGEASLNNINGIIDGDVYVTWSLNLDAAGNTDGHWAMSWEKAPSINMQPTRAELWVDGVKVDDTGSVQMNGPDSLNKIGGMVIDANGKILRYVVGNTAPEMSEGESYAPFIADDAAMDAAIKAGYTTLLLKDGNYIIPDSAQGKTLTIVGNGNTVIATQDDGSYEGCDYSLDGSTVTFKNITINTDSRTYTGYARMNGTYDNCTINGAYTLYGHSVFNNCEFNVSGDTYNIWTWGAKTVTFNGCTFNTDGKSILAYNQSCDLTVTNCVFNDRTNGTGFTKSAIETGVDGIGPKYNIVITNTKVNGFAENDKCVGYQNIVGNKNSLSNEYLNIVVDGVDVY